MESLVLALALAQCPTCPPSTQAFAPSYNFGRQEYDEIFFRRRSSRFEPPVYTFDPRFSPRSSLFADPRFARPRFYDDGCFPRRRGSPLLRLEIGRRR
jgi:hypothetical protein